MNQSLNPQMQSTARQFAQLLNDAKHLSLEQKQQWARLSAYMNRDELEQLMVLLDRQNNTINEFFLKLEKKYQ